MNRLCIGTGWCSNKATEEKHSSRSRLCLQPEWFLKYWKLQIEKFIKPDVYFIYISKCDVMPKIEGFNIELCIGHDEVRNLDSRHDFHCSLMMPAQYAFCNGMDFCYIEQDCMVHGLDKALEFARDKKIVYGFGTQTSFVKDWAEQSFIYVSNDYLPEFIYKLNTNRFHESMTLVPELNFHRQFKEDADFWPFGYGRNLKWINWNESVFYAQQLRDSDIERFQSL
jgi:hypothetical protein